MARRSAWRGGRHGEASSGAMKQMMMWGGEEWNPMPTRRKDERAPGSSVGKRTQPGAAMTPLGCWENMRTVLNPRCRLRAGRREQLSLLGSRSSSGPRNRLLSFRRKKSQKV